MIPETIPLGLALAMSAVTGLICIYVTRREYSERVQEVYDDWQAAERKRRDKQRAEIENRPWDTVTRNPEAERAMPPQRMKLCPVCGNKRCPKATDENLACTDINEPGQPGSRFADATKKPRPAFTSLD